MNGKVKLLKGLIQKKGFSENAINNWKSPKGKRRLAATAKSTYSQLSKTHIKKYYSPLVAKSNTW